MATLITTMPSSMMQEPVTHPQFEGRLCLSGFLKSVDKKAYRIAWLSTGQHADALDIVQDAMLKLVDNTETPPTSTRSNSCFSEF